MNDIFEGEHRRLAWWLLVATKGGPMRMKIITQLSRNPSNLNRISNDLGINYRTAEHHAKILMDNGMIISKGDGYGKTYFISPYFEKNYHIIEEIEEKLKRKSR